MLNYLHVRNLALMDEASLEFSGGFIAVTGETGAGKSVLLGALSLLSGNRADKSLIRQGEDACEVEAALVVADPRRIDAVLKSLDLPTCEDNQLILRRTISRSKASRIHINGELTTLARLQELGEAWIDFHGPGEPQKLFAEAWQLTLLDRFADHDNTLEAYQTHYADWRRQLKERDQLLSQQALTPDEQAFLQSQIDQIDQLNLSEDRILDLERDYNRISSGQELSESAHAIHDGLTGSDGVQEKLAQLLVLARKMGKLDNEANALADRLESLSIEADDLAADCQNLAETMDLSELDVDAIQEDMEAWLSLKRKYGGSVELILQRRAEMADKLERQSDVKGSVARLESSIAKAEKTLWQEADKLRESRQKAARKLARNAADHLGMLGFKKPQLRLEIIREAELTALGASRCRFLFSPNPGQDLQPLNKIASSGELARVMLALKTVLARVDETPVLVFDEVDANIGGEIASTVASQLAELGQTHQVFCITHLPQVAAVANAHFLVVKNQTDRATSVAIQPLELLADARVEEIARMLGDRSSSSGRQHARALLDQHA